MSDTDYVREIEEFFLGMVGQGMALPEGDIGIILEWKARSVPAAIIQKALRKEAARLLDLGRDELPTRLRVYRGAVEKDVSQWLASAEAGFSTQAASTGENDAILRLRSRVATVDQRYRDVLMRCLDDLESDHDPDRINRAIINALTLAMEEQTREAVDMASEQAESRGLRAGMGRMAAKNLGLKVRKQMLCEEVGIEDLFV